MSNPFRRARLRITAWYVGISAGILLLFGGAIYVVVSRQIAEALDRQLVAAVDQLERAAASEPSATDQPRVEALLSLASSISGHGLYLVPAAGVPVGTGALPPFVEDLIPAILAGGELWAHPETRPDASWRVYGRRLTRGTTLVAAVAVASDVEVEEQYTALLMSFLLAALVTLLFVLLGGAALARKTLQPVEASVQRMRRFVADASHELRTPVAVLRTSAEVALQRPRSGAEYAGTLRTVGREAARLGRLVDGLLILAAADEDRLPTRRKPVFLDDLLVQVSELVRVVASAKGVTLELGRFEEAPVVVDEDLVRQLLLILLENAVKYTPVQGRVLAEVKAEGERCTVTIEDTGPGIPAEVLPQVFERFYRADPARDRAGGSGLGLAIAKEIAEAHGAELALESVLGKGTTARVSFPRRHSGTTA